MDIIQRLKVNNNHQRAQVKIFKRILSNGSRFNKALDVSCGDGLFSYMCRGFVNEIYGVDIHNFFDQKNLISHFAKVHFKKYDGKKIPYPSEYFDFVFSMDVLEHVEKPLRFLEEQMRVLKKGGLMLIGTPNLTRIANLPLLLLGKLQFPKVLGHVEYGDCVHIKEYSKEELASFMRQLGIRAFTFVPCYLGVWNYGVSAVPRILEEHCQFWFLYFRKES